MDTVTLPVVERLLEPLPPGADDLKHRINRALAGIILHDEPGEGPALAREAQPEVILAVEVEARRKEHGPVLGRKQMRIDAGRINPGHHLAAVHRHRKFPRGRRRHGAGPVVAPSGKIVRPGHVPALPIRRRGG